jgi:hypothetical protein
VKFANCERRAAAADGEHAVDVADTSGLVDVLFQDSRS